MQARHGKNGTWALHLERGETVRGAIETFAAKEGIDAAAVTAIGAVTEPELGYYHLDRKTYDRRTFPGTHELVSLLGNIARKDGKPFLHAHAVVSADDFAARGGHFFDAKVGVVVEVLVLPLAMTLERTMRDDLGLACWDINAP